MSSSSPLDAHGRLEIKEAFKARPGPYRAFLRYKQWMGSRTGSARWLVMLGLFGLGHAARVVSSEYPEWIPVAGPLLGLLGLFVLAAWISEPLSNLLLRFDPVGRLALTRDEIMGSNLIAGCLLLTLAAGLLSMITRTEAWLLVAISSGLLLLPISATFGGYGMRAWRHLLTGLMILTMCAVATMVLAFVRQDLIAAPVVVQLLGFFVYGWGAEYFIIWAEVNARAAEVDP